jgi:hypothetical protein
VDRWDTPPTSEVKDIPEAEWFLWIAQIVDKIEDEGKMKYFKGEGGVYNPYREKVLDYVCTEAFGSKSPTKEGVYFSHGTMVARLFAKGTQGRADYSRSLRQEADEMIEELGPNMLSSQQLGILRATSAKARNIEDGLGCRSLAIKTEGHAQISCSWV